MTLDTRPNTDPRPPGSYAVKPARDIVQSAPGAVIHTPGSESPRGRYLSQRHPTACDRRKAVRVDFG